ncbi:MAG TPA: IS4 family transposase [Bacteroidales bacterium]|nr:IS4 family transposase [Bacteroidales bacterium]
MKSKHNTIFGQIIQLIPRYKFQKAVLATNSEKGAKGFSSWSHFVALLFGQLCSQTGLRGIVNGLAIQAKKLYHLGILCVKLSTLSYANNHRPHELFQHVFEELLCQTARIAPKHKFKFDNPLYSMDSTTIDLCLSLYDWAKFRKTKAGIKLHVKLDHNGYLPKVVVASVARKHDVPIGREVKFQRGDIVVFDRGYNDYSLFATYCTEGIYFVARLKKNAAYKVVERSDVSQYENISSDQIIEFSGVKAKKNCPLRLRRIRSRNPETGKWIVIITNNMTWSPETIAAIYKERWQIEIFFKTMKQNLKIKSFLGTSRDAVLSQVWVALISYLLLSLLKFRSRFGWTIYNLMRALPMLLFARIDLWAWLNNPFGDGFETIPNQPELEWG